MRDLVIYNGKVKEKAFRKNSMFQFPCVISVKDVLNGSIRTINAIYTEGR